MDTTKKLFPPIGLRLLKTALAVFFCFLADYYRTDGIPFYSAIAAIVTIQPLFSNSFTQALNRTIATFWGGFLGLMVLLLQAKFPILEHPIMFDLVLSISVIILIYFVVLIKKSAAAFITCIVFFSVTVIHGEDISPLAFTINRVIDTLIGVFIALIINGVHFPSWQHKNRIYMIDADDIIDQTSDVFSNSFIIQINQLIERHLKISFVTRHSYSNIHKFLDQFGINQPIALYGGACLYDLSKHEFLEHVEIPHDLYNDIHHFLFQANAAPFIHTLENNFLHIHYTRLDSESNASYYEEIKHMAHQNTSQQRILNDSDVLGLVVIDEHVRIHCLYNDTLQFLKNHPKGHLVHPMLLKHGIDSRYAQFMIVPNEETCEPILEKLKSLTQSKELIIFGPKGISNATNGVVDSDWKHIPKKISVYQQWMNRKA